MDAGNEFPPVDLDCQVAASLVTHRIEQLGLRVLRSFDLRAAACVPSPELPCPHHGSRPCNCQMVVLLVYGPEGPPLSLVAHGYDNQTGFYLVDDPAQPADTTTQNLLRRVFDELGPDTKPTGAMTHAT